MNTVMITGCSSGFGRETAEHFLGKGWHVVATMRAPREDVLPSSDRLRLLPLDVTDRNSIAAAVGAAGEIDALVNNSGIGWMGPLEGTSEETIRDLFETNTFGTMEMVRAVVPQIPEAYLPLADRVFAAHAQAATRQVTEPGDVVAAIWRAVTEPDCPLRLPAGADAVALAA